MNAKNTLVTIRDIPLSKLVPSPINVRRTDRQSGIEALAASIAAHGLLQNLTVQPAADGKGNKSGKFEVLAGGRRLAALQLLAKQKRLAKDAPIPCRVRQDGIARELSLAENVLRENLHPADQFEAFRELHEQQGLGAEEIGARFGVSSHVVKQRLKLGSVSPKLMTLYRQGELTLDQMMAFTVCDDHSRQEELWDALSWDKSPGAIRRSLLQSHVAADDKRAIFLGLEAYGAAGGAITRDLFDDETSGYCADAALLERLVLEKLNAQAELVRKEGWKWVEVAIDFPHAHGLKRLYAMETALSASDAERLAALDAELEELQAELEEEPENDPAKEARYDGLITARDEIQERRYQFEPETIARTGVFVTLGVDGSPEILRGLLKPEDDTPDATEQEALDKAGEAERHGPVGDPAREAETSPLSEKLVADLTAHRTMALRDALGNNPEIALIALTYTLAAQTFLSRLESSCLDLSVRSVSLETLAPGIGNAIAAKKVADRHAQWAHRLPDNGPELWSWVAALSPEDRSALIAHCVSLSVDTTLRGKARSERQDDADRLGAALALDMRHYWQPSVESYFGRVTKEEILAAMREGASPASVSRIAHLKKPEMAKAAETYLASTAWLPAILRTAPPIIDQSPPENP
jgi:ParB family chromosome partitioning protein